MLVGLLDAMGGAAMRVWRRARPTPRVESPRKILIVQLDHLGDAVLTSPLPPILKAAWPDASLAVLASPSNAEVFQADPLIDTVHVATRNWFARGDRAGDWSLLGAVWRLGRTLRREGYDLGIDVRGDVASVFTLALAGIPRRVGWAMGGGGFLLTDVAEWVPDRHEVESRLALARCLKPPLPEPSLAPEWARVRVHPTDEERVRVASWLADAEAAARDFDWPHAPLLAVHPGAGTAAKRWPAESWSELIARFLDDGWRVAVVGGADDLPTIAPMPDHPRLLNWVGRLKLTETAALLERADLFLGADSGPAHLAACAGIASVVLFSGTNRPGQWRPWSRHTLVLRHKVPCSPCHHKVCPLADHPCMTGLTPERVHRAARRWWVRNLNPRLESDGKAVAALPPVRRIEPGRWSAGMRDAIAG